MSFKGYVRRIQQAIERDTDLPPGQLRPEDRGKSLPGVLTSLATSRRYHEHALPVLEWLRQRYSKEKKI